MNSLKYLAILFFCNALNGNSQIDDLSLSAIDKTLLDNANSVVRLDKKIISIPNRQTIEVTTTRIVTVINKNGNKIVNAFKNYDNHTRIKSIEAVVYDKSGKEIKEFSKRDFKDVAAVDGISLFTDSRVKYLDYTPTNYPYTVVFKSATVSKNTAFLPSFYANSGYLSSTEKGYIEINYKADLGLRSKLLGPKDVIETSEEEGKFIYQVENVLPIKAEPYSPGFQKIVAKALFSLDYFHLSGVDGEATSWGEFGKWMDTNLLAGTREIPEKTKSDIRKLVDGIEKDSEKVRLIYEYMQERTRYISVQVGIGGWKPMMASDVDELGYGDCKALSNYTKSLLEVAEIPSYYTILYGDQDKRDIQKDFPSLQGNHAILGVPIEDDYIWLECTNQNVPYGFIADFTDDRDVLVITPEGGKIVHTKIYAEQDNSQFIEGEFTINEEGDINANVSMISKGTQYDDRYEVQRYTEDDKKTHYYNFWKYINNMSLDNIKITEDKEKAEIVEQITFNADKYASFAGEEMLVTLNIFNRFRNQPSKNKNRLHDVEIDRGFKDVDKVTIHIPDGMSVQSVPEDYSISGDFGSYSYSVEQVSDKELLYNRSFTFEEGSYSSEQFEAFRKFLKNVVRQDNQKIVLLKK